MRRYDPECPDIETPIECQVDFETPDVEVTPAAVLRRVAIIRAQLRDAEAHDGKA